VLIEILGGSWLWVYAGGELVEDANDEFCIWCCGCGEEEPDV
jgi:hypothetical protein